MATILLVKESILALKDRTGSSVIAINKWIEAEKKVRMNHLCAASSATHPNLFSYRRHQRSWKLQISLLLSNFCPFQSPHLHPLCEWIKFWRLYEDWRMLSLSQKHQTLLSMVFTEIYVGKITLLQRMKTFSISFLTSSLPHNYHTDNC